MLSNREHAPGRTCSRRVTLKRALHSYEIAATLSVGTTAARMRYGREARRISSGGSHPTVISGECWVGGGCRWLAGRCGRLSPSVCYTARAGQSESSAPEGRPHRRLSAGGVCRRW